MQVSKIIPTFVTEKENIMPELFRKYGFRFYFYTNEHEPIHVHVSKNDGDAKFIITETGKVELKYAYNLKLKEVVKAQKLAEEHKEMIITAWISYFK